MVLPVKRDGRRAWKRCRPGLSGVEVDRTVLCYLAVLGTVFGLNLLPALGPPTWTLLVLFRLNWHLRPVPLVVLGALSAGAGRLVLAQATRRLRDRLPPKHVANLRAAGNYLTGHRGRAAAGLAVFAVSPVPSAQLFEAAGLVDIPLLPLTAAFFVGRLVSYSLYVGAAHAADRRFGTVVRSGLSSPYGIALQVAMVIGVVLLTRVNWAKHLPASGAPPPASSM